MGAPGIVAFLFLGGCLQFLFPRRRQRTQRGKRDCAIDGRKIRKVPINETFSKSHESSVSRKGTKKPSRVSHFCGPQNLNREDQLWLQAYRFGAR